LNPLILVLLLKLFILAHASWLRGEEDYRQDVSAIIEFAERRSASRNEMAELIDALVSSYADGGQNFLLEAILAERYAIPRLDAGELKDTPEFVRRVERLRRKYPEKRYHWRMVRLVQHRYFLEGKYDLSTRWCIDVLAQPEEAIIVPPDDSIPLDWLYDGVLIALVDSVLAKARSPKQERKCVSRLVEELASSPQTAPYSDRVAGIAKKYFGRTSLVKTARDEDGRGRTSRNLFGETSVGVSEKKVNHLPDAVAVAGATNGSRNGRRFIIWVASALLVLFTITIRIWWGNRRGRG